jgi:hypothetical protein
MRASIRPGAGQIGVTAILLCLRLLPRQPAERAGSTPIDWIGLAQLSGGAVLLVLGCTLVGESGSLTWPTAGALGLGLLLAAAFVIRALRVAAPELGYPVQAKSGPGGHYRLVAGTALPPLLLDDDEAVAVAVGLRRAEHAAVGRDDLGEDGDEATRALRKLEQVLPARLRHRVAALAQTTEAAAAPWTRVASNVLAAVGAAAQRHEQVTSPTVRLAPPRRPGGSSRTGRSSPAAAGTCWPGTSTATTGAPSGWTASTISAPRGCVHPTSATGRPRSQYLKDQWRPPRWCTRAPSRGEART